MTREYVDRLIDLQYDLAEAIALSAIHKAAGDYPNQEDDDREVDARDALKDFLLEGL